MHRGQLGDAVPAGLDVVEADDGDVLRNPDAPAAQTLEQVERGAVGPADQRGAAFAGRLGRELPGYDIATELPVRGSTEERQLGEPVRGHHSLVGDVPTAHVTLGGVADEVDAGVAVLDQVVDRGADATVVVAHDVGHVETLQGAGGEHDGLAGILGAADVALVDAPGDRDEAVDVLPADRMDVGDVLAEVVPLLPRVEGLHQRDPVPCGRDLADDAVKGFAEEEAAGQRRQHANVDHAPTCLLPR